LYLREIPEQTFANVCSGISLKYEGISWHPKVCYMGFERYITGVLDDL
jgi:hypothetical protein